MSQQHICQILMREHLKDGSRDSRNTGFRIVLVPNASRIPSTILIRNILINLGKHLFYEIIRYHSGLSVRQTAVVEIRGADAQSTNNTPVHVIAGITMYSKTHFQWNSLTFLFRSKHRTSR